MSGEERINCAIFQKQEPRIKGSTDMINRAKDPREKIKYAEELLGEVKALLDCPDYKKEDVGCSSCRTIATLRKQTAELIIKTKKLI